MTCPNCHAPVAPSDTGCRACGADIQLMTLVFQSGWAGPDRPAPAEPLSTEQLVPRLGDYLVQHGYISAAALQAALDRQAALPNGGRPLLGQTLVEMGSLSPRDLDQAIARRLLELQNALLEANRELERRVTARTAELELALARLSEFDQLKANFVANISHELRTPLTHIKGYNVLLRDGTLGPLTRDQGSALEVTASAVSRLEQLINDLISYAAANQGELTLGMRPVSVASLVLSVVQRSEPKAQARGVGLQHALPAELPLATADEEKLLWTLLQLVDNAIKFTPPAGQVIVGANAAGDRVRLYVQDTGIGIPASRLPEIFEPFRQLDGSSTRRYGGTGLGLALAKRILDAHSAEITVSSEEGRGSTFAFTLPGYTRQA